ncbi:hypothetical protein OsJ_24108 [Oryza sativa Japonica Group]|uniref:Uncharacterized protein n=1 Tax=Oryza sativa subsp. japonica TaxID=39947 RepID=B9FX14_ORYSJ|nr:hypothetical protein OsJ_24108 [Oryza sativa Japonica Group]
MARPRATTAAASRPRRASTKPKAHSFLSPVAPPPPSARARARAGPLLPVVVVAVHPHGGGPQLPLLPGILRLPESRAQVQIQDHACQQLTDEVDKEYKKMSDSINENTEMIKAKYKQIMAEAQSSTSRGIRSILGISYPQYSP